MRVAINDISFQYPFYNQTAALEALDCFLNICVEIKRKRYHYVEQIQCDQIDCNLQLAPGQSLIKLIQNLKQDQISLLLVLLVNSSCPHEGEPFCVDGKSSYACAYAREGIIISLQSHRLFSSAKVEGEIGSLPYEIRNLSDGTHIEQHFEALGYRLYEPNPKHHLVPYLLGGHTVSPMPLCDEEAQNLLDQAIEVDGHLLAKQDDTYFEFRSHSNIRFHGYQNDAISEQIKRKLDEQWPL